MQVHLREVRRRKEIALCSVGHRRGGEGGRAEVRRCHLFVLVMCVYIHILSCSAGSIHSTAQKKPHWRALTATRFYTPRHHLIHFDCVLNWFFVLANVPWDSVVKSPFTQLHTLKKLTTTVFFIKKLMCMCFVEGVQCLCTKKMKKQMINKWQLNSLTMKLSPLKTKYSH